MTKREQYLAAIAKAEKTASAANNGWYKIGEQVNHCYTKVKEVVLWLKEKAEEVANVIIGKIKEFMSKWEWTEKLYNWFESTIQFMYDKAVDLFSWLKERILDGISILSTGAVWLAIQAGKAVSLVTAGIFGKNNPLSIGIRQLILVLEGKLRPDEMNIKEAEDILLDEEILQAIDNDVEESLSYAA